MTPRRVLLVDDERLARQELRTLLQAHPEVENVVEAGTLAEAAAAIEAHDPDVVFLDVQLAGESGFELFDRVPGDFAVIFVTAHDRYAVRAFDVNALDYLLKPVQPARLARALERLPARDETAPLPAALGVDDRLFLRVNDRRAFVRVGAIRAILAEGDYSRLITAEGRGGLVLKPLAEWESRLPGKTFLRIHRSTIVNLDAVERVEEAAPSGHLVYLRGHAEPLRMSRRYAAQIRDRLR